ncbi:winged helix-turn-helix domain-containing protein [Roseateles sp. YR242]|uniref:ATP-binding protein n=1 Tax=Roseateles sp. YR242 TaxID=1855305 RepID=UPI000B827CAE|nr:winged helix-turn-helix domain-containing protein [Roseateles sp. YR242]
MTSRYRFDGFVLDMASRVLLAEGVPVQLSGRQIDLLGALVSQRGAVVSKSELLNRIWPDQAVEENNAAVHVSALRRVLGREAIATVTGQGYRFALALSEDDKLPADAAAGINERALPPARPRALPSLSITVHGRDHDLQTLLSRLVRHRLVTVVGAPGIGKSTLALACAHARRHAAQDGVVWADLQQGGQQWEPQAAVAMALGLDAGTDLPTLLAVLRPMSLLMVLDNAETCAASAAAFCHAVIEGTEDVTLMVTSRKVLRVPGERVLRTPPLSTPALLPASTSARTAGLGRGVDEALSHGAVALFVDQVRAQGTPFALGLHNIDQVVTLCRRLDGHPLALQLAAGRLATFGLDALCERLNDRYRLLTRGTQAGPRRHQSLRACMDDSYVLLSEVEQLVLRRLEPFEGGFTLEMAAAALSDRQLDTWTVAEALEGLVDHSLVQVDGDDRPRYELLESVRAYGLLRLEECGEVHLARHMHAYTLSQLFERAGRAFQMMPDERWVAEFAPELGNVRAALDWCVEHAPVMGLGLLANAGALFELLSLVDEAGWRHAAYENDVPHDLAPEVLARFCIDHAGLMAPHDPAGAGVWFRRGVRASRTADDPAVRYLALCRQVVGDREVSRAAMRHAMGEVTALAGRCEGAHTARLKLWGLAARAHVWRVEGQAGEAEKAICAALRLAREIGATRWLFDDLQRLTLLLVAHGRPLPCAAVLVREWEAVGVDGALRQRLRGCRAAVLLAEGRTREARTVLETLVAPEALRPGGQEAFPRLLPVLAWLASSEGRDADAARLAGYAAPAGPGTPREELAPPWEALLQRLRTRLDDFHIANLREEGQQWDEGEALKAALAVAVEQAENVDQVDEVDQVEPRLAGAKA